jgi:hypothetical protein
MLFSQGRLLLSSLWESLGLCWMVLLSYYSLWIDFGNSCQCISLVEHETYLWSTVWHGKAAGLWGRVWLWIFDPHCQVSERGMIVSGVRCACFLVFGLLSVVCVVPPPHWVSGSEVTGWYVHVFRWMESLRISGELALMHFSIWFCWCMLCQATQLHYQLFIQFVRHSVFS